MNPLTGICPTHRVTRGYRHASPHGERLPSENEGYRSDAPQPTANYSLLTANSYFASGWQTFKYGKLGEVTENIRTFALPFENQTYTFKMKFEYDSWNRIQDMTYPDGEVVHYDYNRGGMLEKVTGHKDGTPYRYIDSICYNQFELKDSVFYGNGTHAHYTYDSLQRLIHLHSECAGGVIQEIDYTYDSVSNITGIANSAGMLPNGLGGTYNSAYTYDDLYRLTSSTGGWQGSQNISYRTTTLYRGNGRIKQKNLAARTLLNGVSDTVNYSHYYHYGNTSQPNTLTRYSSSVWNPGSWLGISNEEDSQFGWDAAGNMTESCIGGDRNCRSLCWDEQNRLQGVKDNKWLSYYQYDAAGDRTYKLTGKGELQNINGEWRYFYHLDNATLYVSPYLVATKQGYTKHYYAETERIASRIGGGRLRYLDQPVVGQGKIVEKQSTNKTYAKEVLEECLDAIHSEGQADLHHLYDMINSAHSETDCYWYHPDHLGSSSWITDSAGTAVQHLHYLPWGEDFVNQRSTSWNAMYTFSAKERDSETGLSYFGSRYYSSDLSVWLSVDPMAHKYPSLSPYTYCANNPVKLVDPNGDTISLLGDDWESALAHMQNHCPNLEISRGENGCLSYSYKKGVKFNQKGAAIVSDEETMFCKAIDSKEVKVSLTANYKNVYTAKNGKQYKSNMGGGFLGSKYNENKTADAEQFVSMMILNKYYASEDIGRLLLHEATEAYWGGKRAIKLQRDTCIPQSNIFGQYEECDDYNYAHNKAISQPTTRFEKFMSRTSYDLLLYHLRKGH